MTFLIIYFDKNYIDTIPEIKIRISTIPFLFFVAIISAYVTILAIYILFKIFAHKETKLNIIFDEFTKKYIVLNVVCEIVTLVLLRFTSKYTVNLVSDIIIAFVMCVFINNYMNKIKFSNCKKYIILAIIFIFSFII